MKQIPISNNNKDVDVIAIIWVLGVKVSWYAFMFYYTR